MNCPVDSCAAELKVVHVDETVAHAVCPSCQPEYTPRTITAVDTVLCLLLLPVIFVAGHLVVFASNVWSPRS